MRDVPVWIIGGYLGSGKTTLLNAVLRNARGVRYAVLVNDFGSVNVDAESIASTGAHTIELTNGCTCCTIGGDLILALKELLGRDVPPERIVIEASGVADPQAVARIAACHPALSVQSTIVVADAEAIRGRIEDKYVGGLVRRQLEGAGVIVLSKTDLLDAARVAVVREWISRNFPTPPLVESSGAANVLAEIGLSSGLAVRPSDLAAAEGSSGHPDFKSMTYRSANPLDRSCFVDAVRAMIPEVDRAKGTVYFAEEPDVCYLFQLSGERWSVEPVAPHSELGQTQIVAVAAAERATGLARAMEMLTACSSRLGKPAAPSSRC